MGYQEFTFKVNKPKQFLKNKKEIDDYMKKTCLSDVCNYSLLEIKEQIGEMDKGIYLYITGDRGGGRKLIEYLGNRLDSSYNSTIESCLGMWGGNEKEFEKNSINLTKLFKDKRGKVGNILIESQPRVKELERG